MGNLERYGCEWRALVHRDHLPGARLGAWLLPGLPLSMQSHPSTLQLLKQKSPYHKTPAIAPPWASCHLDVNMSVRMPRNSPSPK